MRKLMEATASSPARSRNPSSIVRRASASQEATAPRMRGGGPRPGGGGAAGAVHPDIGGHLLQGIDGALDLSLPPASHLVDDDRRVRGNAGELNRRHGDTLGILYSRRQGARGANRSRAATRLRSRCRGRGGGAPGAGTSGG